MWYQHSISMIFSFKNYYSILFLLVIISSPMLSTETNGESIKLSNSNVTITSDFLNLDNNNLSATFKGAVTIIFEDIILKTNNLMIYYTNNDNKRSVERIEIPGKLKTIKKIGNEIVVADSGKYIAALNKLILTGNVNMQKDKYIVVTDKMIYFPNIKFTSKKNNER